MNNLACCPMAQVGEADFSKCNLLIIASDTGDWSDAAARRSASAASIEPLLRGMAPNVDLILHNDEIVVDDYSNYISINGMQLTNYSLKLSACGQRWNRQRETHLDGTNNVAERREPSGRGRWIKERYRTMRTYKRLASLYNLAHLIPYLA